ncbi:MAG: ATP-dependent endonuclease [Bacteroidota bacterium]
MKIFKIEIDNFRLLRDFSMDLENELSLVIGKNNTGKTSILVVLEKFLNQSDRNKFLFDDFNIEYKKILKDTIESEDMLLEENYVTSGIKLKIFIEYNGHDNLSNVSRVMMDLDPGNNIIVLGFEYILDYSGYIKIRNAFVEYKRIEVEKAGKDENYKVKGAYDFLKQKQGEFFLFHKKSFEYDLANAVVNEDTYINLISEDISTRDIINFKFISARRDVTNKEVDKTLSGQTSRIYEKTESTEEQNNAVNDFKEKLSETDDHLSGIYKSLFNGIVQKVKIFGGVKANESDIEIISTLQHRELLKGNTTVVYKHDEENRLPEHYNGLGYMNLISMIFEIEILVHEFKREADKIPADINLLFIEEPEAHTHPQMQYVFIKNIKKLLAEGVVRKDGIQRKLQYIISTHSSHIVADSDFNDIKYLKKQEMNGIDAKNLKDLKRDYDIDTNQYQFLTQYLTISRAEIFFAEKAILIEGDTERILIPTLMRKTDIEERRRFEAAREEDDCLPLLSQNISIIEVGAYSHIFEKFIDFLGIKSLIITDLDAVGDDGKACEVILGTGYSNAALSFFFGAATINALKGYAIANKCFNKVAGAWQNAADGKLCVIYQMEDEGYNARSFEDAFIHINRPFIVADKTNFNGLQNREYFDEAANGAYYLAAQCIKKKTHFAMDIIYHSNAEFTNWKTPSYIKEGLLWLKQD